MIKTYYQIWIADKNGKIIHRTHKRRSHSFVRQFLQIFYPHTSEIAYNGVVTDITNATKNIVQNSNNFGMAGGVGDDEVGIVVGTGSTAESVDDYKLDTKIVHGAGGGELQYGNQAFNIPVVGATEVNYVITRTFVNGSGGAIVVAEIGIDIEATSAAANFLAVRDVLPSTESVADGLTLTVQYTFTTTV